MNSAGTSRSGLSGRTTSAAPKGRPDTRLSWETGRVIVLFVLLFATACSRRPAPALGNPGSLRGSNVLLVTIDTLRQDRVGAYGHGGLTPTLDRLAANGVRFAHAYTTAPLTLPAHASILTGLVPRRHGIHNNTGFRLDDQAPTLASLLARAGYRTGAFVGAFVLDARFGLNRGFSVYDDHLPHGDRETFHFAERRAADVVRLAGDWILGGNPQSPVPSPQPPAPSPESAVPNPPKPQSPIPNPWFAWVHLFDPHAPYDAPPEYRSGRTPYEAEVAYTDAMIGALLARLQAAHALDHTLVVVTADHGESLGEHGETTHGLFAYNATLAVPLIVSAPQATAGTVDAPVSHVDLLPTILDLVGVGLASAVDGESLARTPPAERALRFEALDASLTRGWAPLRGVVQGTWKYIDLPDPELYDLAADPQEQRNLVDRDPHADLLRRLLATAGADTTAPRVALDADAAARLRSLGYAGGSWFRRGVTAADDPKRLVGLNERFNTALTAFDGGHPREALSALQDIVRERPDFAAARASAATILVATGSPGAAVDLLRAGLADQPDSPELLARLGTALRGAGDLRGSADALERARRAGADQPEVVNDLAVAYAGLGRADLARALFRQLLEQNPASATTWFNLGLFELQSRHPDAAAVAFRRATSLEPSYGEAWQALGAALVATHPREAIDAWRRAEPLLPHDYDLLFNLGISLAGSDTPHEALPYLRRFAGEAPRDRYADDIARVRKSIERLERPAR
jgi:arylsulfatase A-like enzyme/Flp pilus assembly protein TadD